MKYQIEVFRHGGRSFFSEWFDDLDPAIAARVDRSIRRLETGNFDRQKRCEAVCLSYECISAPVIGYIMD